MKTNLKQSQELIGRWSAEMFKANPDWSVEQRENYAHSLLGKIRGLKAKDVSTLYDFCIEISA